MFFCIFFLSDCIGRHSICLAFSFVLILCYHILICSCVLPQTCVYVCGWVGVCQGWWGRQEQLAGVCCVFPPCGHGGSDSGHLSWLQMCLSTVLAALALCFVFGDGIALCMPGWPRVCCVAHTGTCLLSAEMTGMSHHICTGVSLSGGSCMTQVITHADLCRPPGQEPLNSLLCIYLFSYWGACMGDF